MGHPIVTAATERDHQTMPKAQRRQELLRCRQRTHSSWIWNTGIGLGMGLSLLHWLLQR
jgi:hypothetical protein